MVLAVPFQVEGIDYSPAGIKALRGEIIKYRDEAMKQMDFEVAVTLSHTIAILAYTVELVGGTIDVDR